jgi:hypothetical protein
LPIAGGLATFLAACSVDTYDAAVVDLDEPDVVEPDVVEPEPQAKLAWSGASLLGVHDAPMSEELFELFPSGGGYVVETRYSTDFDWLADLGPRTSWARSHGFEPIVRLDYARPKATTYADGAPTSGATIPPPGNVGWCLARAGGGPSRSVGGRHLDCFLAYVAEAVAAAPDAHSWIIGNEMNLGLEALGFDKRVIPASWYAEVYRAARARIRSTPGHAADVVMVGAVAPGAAAPADGIEGRYTSGKDYLSSLLYAVSPDEVDGIAMHAYGGWVRPCDNDNTPALEAFEWGQNGGLGFKSQAQWIDALGFSRTPLLITEMSAHMHVTAGPGDKKCKDDKLNKNNAYLVDRKEHAAFVRDAYASLHAWNLTPGNHDIVAGVWFTYDDKATFASESLRHLGALVDEHANANNYASTPEQNPYLAMREIAANAKYPRGNPEHHGRCWASTAGTPLHPDGAPFALRGAIRDSWKKNGGVPIFGLPIEEASCQADARGRVLYAQHTQRARLEVHPELAKSPYEVSFGLVGRQLAPKHGVDPDAWSHAGAPHGSDCEFIGPNLQVGHYVCGSLLAYWKSHGVDDKSLTPRDRSLRLFGYPISPPVTTDGRTVQWFERARLEIHPENDKAHEILGGLLGCEASGQKGWGCQP